MHGWSGACALYLKLYSTKIHHMHISHMHIIIIPTYNVVWYKKYEVMHAFRVEYIGNRTCVYLGMIESDSCVLPTSYT